MTPVYSLVKKCQPVLGWGVALTKLNTEKFIYTSRAVTPQKSLRLIILTVYDGFVKIGQPVSGVLTKFNIENFNASIKYSVYILPKISVKSL